MMLGSSADQKELRELLLKALARCGRKIFTHARYSEKTSVFVSLVLYTEQAPNTKPLGSYRSALAISKLLVEFNRRAKSPVYPWSIFLDTDGRLDFVAVRRPYQAKKGQKTNLFVIPAEAKVEKPKKRKLKRAG